MRTFPSRGCPAGAGPEHRARTKVTLMLYEYQGFWKCKAHCDIESCTRPDGKRVFIATELPCNPGTSITNMAEELATAVRKMHGIFTDQFIWIEHYPAHQDPSQPHLVHAETYDLVRFSYDELGNYIQPQWRRLTSEQLQGLLTGTLEADAIWSGLKKG